MVYDRLTYLEFDAPEQDFVEILAEFIKLNLEGAESVARSRHEERRIVSGEVYRGRSADGEPGRWIDWEFDEEMSTCRAHRNIARWAHETRNRWLLGQIAILYGGHPLWNDTWIDGVEGDEYTKLT